MLSDEQNFADLLTRVGRALEGEHWQAPIARLLGVHKDTVQDWRHGRMRPRLGVWLDLLEMLSARRRELPDLERELRAAIAAQSRTQAKP